jgi:hypothetical protein
VAVQGADLEALTGDDTFRIPLARCSLGSEGRRILVRDQQSSLVIWSDDDHFLRALERAEGGTLTRRVQSLRAAARRRTLLRWCGSAVVLAGAVCAAAVPFTRWAIVGGVPSIAARIGESAIETLALPAGIAPEVDGALTVIADQLRPMTLPSTRSFRLLLAGYSDVHSFGLPPGTVVVTAGLVCAAEAPGVVMATVARELAHLENHDLCKRVAGAVDWHTALDLVRGDTSTMRARMLDFADLSRFPGFPPEQQAAAEQRASAMLAAVAAPRHANSDKDGADGIPGDLDWSKVHTEACELIGR